jgi:hypothetical protein
MNAIPKTDPEFKNLIPPLSEDEREQLEQNIVLSGKCREAIILWNGIIIDRHHRFGICVKHQVQFEVKEMFFNSREEVKIWIL